jgi:cysteine-rich repeat protein
VNDVELFSEDRKVKMNRLVLLGLFAGVVAWLLGAQAATAQSVLVNEVHYDNDGADVGEFVEIIGGAGADVSGWSIVPINGNGGAEYSPYTFPASTFLDSNGLISVAIVGLQNGSPDGIVICDNTGAFVSGVSYEGSFAVTASATCPGAVGQNLPDIGTESSTSPVGNSISSCPDGSAPATFVATPESPGALNICAPPDGACCQPGNTCTVKTALDCQALDGVYLGDGVACSSCPVGGTASVGDIVVNEFMPNPDAVSDSAGEYVELVNTTGSAIDIEGWTLKDDGSDSVVLFNSGLGLVVPAGGILLLGNNDDSLTNGGAPVDFDWTTVGDFFLSNSDDEIVLVDGAATEIDRVVYDGTFPWGTGVSAQLIDPALDNNVATSWCAGQSAYGDGDLGTPGATNDCPGPELIINEVDSDTPGTDTLEFIEIYDGGVGNTPLDGYAVVLYNGSDNLSYTPAFDLDGYSTDANGYFVLGNTAVVEKDLDIGASNIIQNGPDAVALYLDDAVNFPNDTPITLVNLVDAIVYDTDDADNPTLLSLLNVGQPQVNENGNGLKDDESNQRCPNGSGGALNTDTYQQWPPTPGAENVCQAVVEGVFLNEIYASHDGTDDQEMIELIGTPALSLDGYCVAIVEGEGLAAGTLDRLWDLTGLSIPASGYFVLGDTAVTPNDLDIGASNAIENGTETFYLLQCDYATLSALVATDLDTNDDTLIFSAGGEQAASATIVDIIAMIDGDYPAIDFVYDGSDTRGPDGSYLPPGIFRDEDYPGDWCDVFLDYYDVTNAVLPRTPGAMNGPCPVCGDGVTDAPEECDDAGESASCDADCTLAECGDGTLNTTAGEECDDGNTTPGDGCDASCLIEVGPVGACCVAGGAASKDGSSTTAVNDGGSFGANDYYAQGNDDSFEVYSVTTFNFSPADFGGTVTGITSATLTLTVNDRTFSAGDSVEIFFTSDSDLSGLTFNTGIANGIDGTQFSFAPVSLGVFPITELSGRSGGETDTFALTFGGGALTELINTINAGADFQIILGVADVADALTYSGVGNTFDPGDPNLAIVATTDPTGACTVVPESECIGTFLGDATDCIPNECPQPDAPPVIINEVRMDASFDAGCSNGPSWFELYSSDNSGVSLDGLTYVILGDCNSGGDLATGVIEEAVPLSGLSFAGGSNYFVMKQDPGDPLDADCLPNVAGEFDAVYPDIRMETNDNITHLLVQGYTGPLGDDVDNNCLDVDLDDDCLIDNPPWARILDAVGFGDDADNSAVGGSNECQYGAADDGDGTEEFCGFDLDGGGFAPAHCSRCPDGTDAPGGNWPTDVGQDSFNVGSNDTPRAQNVCCGDGVPEGSEECDDGNAIAGDGCRPDCTAEVCGDGTLDAPGEECDDGNTANGDGCDENCIVEECGNGVLQTGELCDDGNTTNGDGCDEDCIPEECGNGVLQFGEECDDANTTPGDGCDENCIIEECGNGVLQSGEECDDGNTATGDGCDENCIVEECGNGVVQAGEDCDDAGESATCDDDCTLVECGDSNVNHAAGEDCDTGGVETSSCDLDCTIAECGDNLKNATAGEQCDGTDDSFCPGLCQEDCQCPPPPPVIPTVTEWGLIVMTLLGLVAGTIVFTRRRVVA